MAAPERPITASWEPWVAAAAWVLPVAGAQGAPALPLLTVGLATSWLALRALAGAGCWWRRLVALEVLSLSTLAGWIALTRLLGLPAPGVALGAALALASCAAGSWLAGTRAWPRALASWRWDRALALLLLTLAVSALGSASYTGAQVEGWAFAFLVAAGSLWPVSVVSLLALLPGRPGAIGSGVTLVALHVAVIWWTASGMVYAEQARPLLWPELRFRLADGASLAVLGEGLASVASLLAAVAVYGGGWLLLRRLAQCPRERSGLAWVRLHAALAACGVLLAASPTLEPALAARWLEEVTPPWSPRHRVPAVPASLDLAVARERRSEVGPPSWQPGAATPLDGLAGRYPRRSVVVVVLESHRASDVAGLGEGAFGHVAASPELSALAGEGVLFTGYVAGGWATSSALWSLFTGLPEARGNPAAAHRAPEAAAVGRLPDFLRHGYRSEWLCPTPPTFDNWDRLLSAAGVQRWWLDNDEVAGLPRDLWTAWGMPDEQLYAVARQRLHDALSDERPVLLGLLTTSNHWPYRILGQIAGQPLTRDHVGGMRYADHALGRFLSELRGLDAARRPIVFVTADTAHAAGLRDASPLGKDGLETLRVPGLLLLPDDRLAGTRFDGLFTHQDLLDLLWLLVGDEGADRGRFVRFHRAAVLARGGGVVVTEDALLLTREDRLLRISERWRLVDDPNAPGGDLARAAFADYLASQRRLWGSGD